MELFHCPAKATIGDGSHASFWNDPWADGISPKCIAPSIFALSNRKMLNVRNSITDNASVLHLDTSGDLSVQHLQEFTNLWAYTLQLNLRDDVLESIIWKLTDNGAYSCSSAYKVQFAKTILLCMDSIVWKIWAPPNCKLFACLIIQNWLCTLVTERG
jgi:hypothetical protein